MKRIMCMALVLALSMVVIGGCKKKEEKPQDAAANAVSKGLSDAGKAVSDAGKTVSDAAKK